MSRRRALMGKGEMPILNPAVGLTENMKLVMDISAPYLTARSGAAVTDFILAGTSGNFVYYNPDTPSVRDPGNPYYCGKILQYSSNAQNALYTDQWNCKMSGTEGSIALSSGKQYIRLSLPMVNLAGVYAYNSATGKVYYAGKDSPYYGKTNIND